MAQQLRVLADFAEDLDSISNIYMTVLRYP